MVAARLRGDLRTYLEVVARVPLYLPATAGREGFVLWPVDGVKHLVAFTSPETLAAAMGPEAAANPTVVHYPELLAGWPDPSWLLGLNPRAPIDLFVPVGRVRELLAAEPAPTTLAGALAETAPAADPADALRAALATGDGDRVLAALVAADVELPATGPVPAGRAGPDWERFPWLLRTGLTGGTTLPVFGSVAAALASGLLPEGAGTVRVPLVELARHWPAAADQLAVEPDPSGRVLLVLPAQAVAGLPDWREAMDGGERLTAPPAGTPPVPGVLAGARGRPGAPPDAASPPAAVPMLKVLPPGMAENYLVGGYHRVSGLVYPAGPLAGVDTPAELYGVLGLTAGVTPFDPADREVHLIRWDAYRPELFPVAFGASNSRALELLGGWLIEPEPFVGAGVAPGALPVPELMVNGVVLPHGARLCRLDATGGETEVATYDADFHSWVARQTTDLAALLRSS